jgi:hypothetical protein
VRPVRQTDTYTHTQRQINRQKDGRTDTPLVSGLCELSCGSGSTLCRIQSEREARREVERDGWREKEEEEMNGGMKE